MRVTDLEQVRVERLAHEIAVELRANGVARVGVEEAESVDRWRRAARRADRLLGWRVRTGARSGWVYVSSDNWPPPPGADREAAERVGAIIFAEPRSAADLKVLPPSDGQRGPRL
jgi:hypothetical protein